MVSIFRRFQRNERGAIIVWFALTLPVIFGLFALSLDLGRFTGMNTEMKALADAAALAAANNLDRSNKAFEKAEAAAKALVNSPKFAESGGTLTDLRYASSYANLKAGVYLDESKPEEGKKAAWVQAITSTGTVNGLFIKVSGGDPTMTSVARSTAASHAVACEVQPLFMCLPKGGQDLITRGQMVRVKEKSGSAWGAGNFGLLDPPYTGIDDGQKAKMIMKNLASSDPDSCYINKLSVATGGVAGPVQAGLNVRFDIFDSSTDASIKIPPGPNNFKGGNLYTDKADQCVKNTKVPRGDGGMPRDTAFPDDGPYGNGVWDGTTYWKTHYGTATYPGFTSRFDMYLAELGLAMDNDGKISSIAKPSPVSSDPEYGKMGPVCAASNGITGTGTWERRVIYAAMVDCEANAEWLQSGNSAKAPLESADIGMFFLTEPTEKGQEIYLEFVKRVGKGTGAGKLHNIVQLYPNPPSTNADDLNNGN